MNAYWSSVKAITDDTVIVNMGKITAFIDMDDKLILKARRC
jgi:hypothetical protein